MNQMYNKNKTAQFYLLAAIVIIALILGFATVANYVKKRSVVKIYDVKEELNIESGNVLDFGTYKEEDVDMDKLLTHFTTLYTTYSGEDKNIYYILGNEDNIYGYSYEEFTTGKITINIGGESILEIRERKQTPLGDIEKDGEKIKVTINDVPYEFDLQPGESFYFVISQEIEGEQHIVSG